MKRSMRCLSILLAIVFLMSNGLNLIVNPVFAASPLKKEKFIIKHANNEKLKAKFIDSYISEESPKTTEDALTIDNLIDLKTSFFEIQAETKNLNIVAESITDEISVVEATQSELAEIFEGVDIYNVEIDQVVSVNEDIYPPNLQLIGEDKINDPSYTGKGIKIAILDTGIAVDNPELNVAGGVSFIPGTTYNDDHGHGTALAGVIGAKENGEGIVGIAPDAELYAVKVLDSNGNGYYSDVIKGLEWCIENRIDIVLMSFGANVYSGILHETIQKAYLQDTLLIGAAGNSDAQVQYPAAYNEVMAIGAVDETDSPIYCYTNKDIIDIYAIGENITSLELTGSQAIFAGSSFSAAHVAGVAAEIWSGNLVKTNAMIRQHLISSATADESNLIPILNAYQAYLDSTEEIEADPGDDLSPIEDDSDEDAQVSILAECSNDVDVKLDKDIIIYVKFSGDHTKVEAELINEATGVTEGTVKLYDIKGSYDYENNEYTGQEYAFYFGKAEKCGATYHVNFTPYQEDENGYEIEAWPFESNSFRIVAPDLVCMYIDPKLDDIIPGKPLNVGVGVKNIGDASFEGEAIFHLYLTEKNKSDRLVVSKTIGNLSAGASYFTVLSWDANKEDVGEYSLRAEIKRLYGDIESNANNNDITLPYCITVSLADGTNIPIFSESTSDPVDTASGNYTISVADMTISGKAPFELIRSYNATDYKTSSFGPHWKHNYNIYYQDVEDYIKVYLEDGSVEFFDLLDSGEYSFNKTKYKNVYYDSNGSFTIEFKGNKTYKFNEKYIGQITGNANTTFITYENDLLKKIESLSGFISFVYDNDRIDYLVDSAGRTVDYQYTNGNLTGITNVDGNTWHYEYNDKGLITKSIDYASNVQLINVYDDVSRVVEQINEDGSVTRYVHTDDTVTFTEKNGSVTVYHKDSKGRLIFREYPDGAEKYVYDDNDNIIKFVDKNGNAYNYYYNEVGNLESSADSLGQTTSYTYDENGNVTSEQHADGSKITYTYNSAGKTTSVTDEIGRTTRFIYDGIYNVEKTILPDGSESIMTYYPNGNLHTITDADENTTTYSYDALNRVTEVVNAEGYITKTSYLPSGKIEKVINPDGTSIRNEYDCEGQLVKTIDEAGRETAYAYTPMGDIWSITYPDNTTTNFTYNVMQQVESIIYADGSSIQNEYDNAGRLIKVIDQLGNAQTFTYDNNGNILTQKDGNGNITTYQYDELNRQKAVINALSQKTQYGYRYDGKITSITDALNNVTTMEYDPAGQLIKEILPNGAETNYDYDLLGRVSSIADAKGQIISYEYNALGKITKITNPDGSYKTMTYDRIGNLISSINELGAVTTYEYDSMSRILSTKDSLGNTTQMFYGLDGKLESIIDANGNTSSFQYDVMGRLIKETNPRGFETFYTYDVLGNLTEVQKHNGLEEILTVYAYNGKNQLVREVSPIGATTLYTYDANGNMIKKTDAEGYETVSAYDSVNNLTNVTRPDGNQIKYAYDVLNRVTEVTDGEGNITKFAYDSNGNILSETDPMGNITNYSYDALNQLTSVTNALGNTTSYTYRYDGKVETFTDAMNNLFINEYDAAGQLVKEILPNNYTTSYTYDLLGRVSSVTGTEGLVTEFTYDGLGNILKKAYSNGTFETMAYDINSNLVKSIDAMGNITQYSYDFDDRLISIIDALGYKKSTSYTKDGQVSSITDGNGNKTSYQYNLLGKATKTIDGLGNEVNYTYDPVGNLIKIHQYKGVTASTLSLMNDAPSYATELDEVIIEYEYNSNGQLTKEINPSGTTVKYAYDKNGNLISKEDEDGYVTTYSYDSVNNLTSIIYDLGKTVSYTYNPNNQITSMTDWLGTNTYDLDVLGRINTVTDYEGRVTGYTWNSRNQKLSMTYPDGSLVKYSYDIKGNLLKVIDGNGKETSYTYDALDRIKSEVLPNGVKTIKTYDALSRITGETSTKKDGSVIYSNTYTLDGEGNILTETKKVNENGNKLSSYITEYIYDSNNQLVQIKDSEGILEKYFYDTLGNRIQKERTVPGNGNSQLSSKAGGNNKNKNNNENNNKSSINITKYTYNNENQMLTLQGQDEEVAGHYTNGELVTFTFDKRGNVRSITTDSGTIGQYYYDDTNKMTYSINKMGIKSGYTYDGAERRVKETLEHSNINVPEKASLHVQAPIEELLDINQNIALDVKKEINYVIDSTSIDNRVLVVYGMQTKTQRYTYGNGVIGLDSWNDKATDWEDINQDKHDEQLYYLKDFRGSVLALTDYKCKITTSYAYNAFGTPTEKNHVNDQGIRSNIYHYAGYIYDYTTSLYYVNARYYMPETARFLAEDAFKGDGLNRYVYVRNNPLVYVDPMGYACSEVNSANTLLQGLLKIIESYPFSWQNIIGIKTKEQIELIAQANTVKDAIKKTDDYKNDEVFRLLVDGTFDSKSYKEIGKVEDVQRLIDYLETGLIVLNINNYNKSNIFNEAGNIIKDIALGMGSALTKTLIGAEKVLFYDPLAGIADFIGWHQAGDYIRRSFNQAANTVNSFIKDNVTYHDVFNSAETGTYIAQLAYGCYSIYVSFTSSSVVLKPSYNPALDSKGTLKTINPNEIRFTQNSIKSTFKNGDLVDDLIQGLKSGNISADDIPAIRIFEKDGIIYSLDNRRLYAFKEASIDNFKTVWATAEEIANEAWKFTTKNGGTSIRVR